MEIQKKRLKWIEDLTSNTDMRIEEEEFQDVDILKILKTPRIKPKMLIKRL